MVYAPQRRHAVASLSSTLQALAILQHLYSPNFWVLLGRLLVQLQIHAPPLLAPTRSLFGLFFLVTLSNGIAVLIHWASGPPDGSSGVPIDFIGQKNLASMTRILMLDALFYFLQLIMLVVCYVVNYGPTLPKPSVFPYPDLLLPPDVQRDIAAPDIDVESGDQLRQRRLGKGPRYQQVANDDDTEMWVEEEGELEDGDSLRSSSNPRLVATSYGSRRPSSGVPLIFNISLSHLLNLIFRVTPPVQPGLTSGGTPSQTPPGTPRPPSHEVAILAAALARAVENREEFHGLQPLAASNRAAGTSSRPQSEPSSPPSGDEEEDRARIPGDYWASRANS